MTTTLAPRPTVVAEPPAPPSAALRTRSPGIRAIAIIVGAGAMLASFAGSWIPSLWGDETVSIMSAERSLPSLFSALGHIDAVHGGYYLFLHGWIGLFGTSELSVRLPSAIAVGFAAAGTVILGNLLLSRRIGIIAGVVLALLPRVTYIGMEARSFALSMAIAVWLTILFVRLLVRRTVSRLAWLAYAIAFSLAVYLFLYLSLLAVVHGVLLLSSTRAKGAFRRWLQAVGFGVLLAAPVVVWGLAQNHQISSIAPSQVTLQALFVGAVVWRDLASDPVLGPDRARCCLDHPIRPCHPERSGAGDRVAGAAAGHSPDRQCGDRADVCHPIPGLLRASGGAVDRCRHRRPPPELDAGIRRRARGGARAARLRRAARPVRDGRRKRLAAGFRRRRRTRPPRRRRRFRACFSAVPDAATGAALLPRRLSRGCATSNS